MADNVSPLRVLREQLPRFWDELQAADMREFLSRQTPIAAARGAVSGVLGAPGDIESLVRMLPGLSEKTVLPTSEDIEKRLPGRSYSESPMAQAITTGGQLAGGFYNGPGSPLRAVASLPAALQHGAGEFARTMAIPTANVVKPKGGQWLTGSVENALNPFRRMPPRERSREFLTRTTDMSPGDIEEIVMTKPDVPLSAAEEAINRWVEGPLTRYIKTYAGTLEDPVRLAVDRRASDAQKAYDIAARKAGQQMARAERIQAEGPRPGMPRDVWEGAMDRARFQGETTMDEAEKALMLAESGQAHVPRRLFDTQGAPGYVPQMLRNTRTAHGYPELGAAESSVGKMWERASDLMVRPMKAGEASAEELASNPWLAKLAPEDVVYKMPENRPFDLYNQYTSDARIYELLDTLEGAMKPKVKLPENLQLRPEDLSGYSMEKAVQRAADINLYKAEQKALKDAEKARKLAQSPAVKTFKEYPENNPRGLSWVEIVKPETDNASKILGEQLKNEGRLMDNCVGGYCSKVEGGKTRIYSLRDPKGQPHVTIEVAPNESGTQSIVQIKGKQNKAPAAQYLPFVQDFVKSGQWSKVGDLENTGLRSTRDVWNEMEQARIRGAGKEFGDYLSPEEIESINSSVWPKRDGFATGGLVGGLGSGYNEALVDEMVEQLRSEYGV